MLMALLALEKQKISKKTKFRKLFLSPDGGSECSATSIGVGIGGFRIGFLS